MKIEVSEELAELIDCRVQSGEYPSASAVVEKAMALLEEQDHELRAFIQEGIDALENGDYVEYTDENLHELVEDVHRRGRERALVLEGIDALESGDFTTYTKENLHELFDEVKREGRLRRKRREERMKRLAKSKTVNG